MTHRPRVPADPAQLRVETWLRQSRDRMPPPDPERVLGPVLRELPGVTRAPVPAVVRPGPFPPHPPAGRRAIDGIVLVASAFILVAFVGLLFQTVSIERNDDGALIGADVTPAPTDAATSAPTSAPPTASPEPPAPPPVLLAGVNLTLTAVEPGVYRVDGDGQRDLRWTEDAGAAAAHIVAGRDDSVWIFRDDGHFRLGGEGTWPRGKSLGGIRADDRIEIGPGGHILMQVVDHRGGANLFDVAEGFGPSSRSTPLHAQRFRTFDIAPDGVVWGLRSQRICDDGKDCAHRLRRFADGESWLTLELEHPSEPSGLRYSTNAHLWTTAGGGLWTLDVWQVDSDDADRPVTAASRRVGDRLELVEAIDERLSEADANETGVLWARVGRREFGSHLARFDRQGWQTFDADDGVPGLGNRNLHAQQPYGDLRVGPDGSVWLTPIILGTLECDGVANFDGQRLASYLGDRCVVGLDVAADGTVWVLAHEESGDDQLEISTYAIPPQTQSKR